MRILQITASLKIGGAEKITKDIGMGALEAGHQVHYLVFGDEVGEYEEELLSRGAGVYHFPSPSAGYGRFVCSLKKLMRENRYDVVHAHTMFNIGWAMYAAKQCGVPARIAHAHSALNDGGGLQKRAYEQIMRSAILKCATHLVACGDAAGIRLFGEKVYRERGIRILNGIDVSAYAYHSEIRERLREHTGLQDAFVIGNVGHLAKVKNQSFLVRLLPEILKRRQNAKLLMLGEGEDRHMLEQLVQQLGLEKHVIMTGNVRNVADYLCAMDVFALPSLYEGMPLTAIEAQANGLPCILSDGVPDDVHLTELVRSISLDDMQLWTDSLCSAERKDAEHFAGELLAQGLDTSAVTNRFIRLYEGAL